MENVAAGCLVARFSCRLDKCLGASGYSSGICLWTRRPDYLGDSIIFVVWTNGGRTYSSLSLSLQHIYTYIHAQTLIFHGLAKPNRRYHLGVDRYPKNPCFAGPSSLIDTSTSWQRIAANYRKWTSHPRRFRTLKKSSSNPCVRIESWTGSLERTG